MAWIGKALFVIGVVHSLFGLVVLRSTLAVLWNEGLINTVNGQPDREFAFWFIAFGILTMILGAFVDSCEKRRIPFPRFFGWTLLAFTAVMVTIMPISGAWLVLIPAIGAILRGAYRSASERKAV